MSEVSEPSSQTPESREDNILGRILIIKSGIFAAAVITSLFLTDIRFTGGLAIGGALGFLNYYWLRSSLGASLDKAARTGKAEPAAVWVIKHNVRFFSLCLIIIGIHLTGLVPLLSVIGGLLFLAAAIVVEGFIQIFFVVFRREEI